MSEYTPTTEEIRRIIEWRQKIWRDQITVEAFDRWLAGLAEALVPPWDSDRACFGHCDKEGWYGECVSKAADAAAGVVAEEPEWEYDVLLTSPELPPTIHRRRPAGSWVPVEQGDDDA